MYGKLYVYGICVIVLLILLIIFQRYKKECANDVPKNKKKKADKPKKKNIKTSLETDKQSNTNIESYSDTTKETNVSNWVLTKHINRFKKTQDEYIQSLNNGTL